MLLGLNPVCDLKDERTVNCDWPIAGRYCETLGWLSMSGFDPKISNATKKPEGVLNPSRKPIQVNVTGTKTYTVGPTATNPAIATATSNLLYARRYLDWNRRTFAFHALGSQDRILNFPTGEKITQDIFGSREALNLTEVIGCIPESYCVDCKKAGEPGSLYTLLLTALGEVIINKARANISRLILTNTGSVRYDLVKGPFTL